jgi:tetratricopeptide (TPR) repeat protein
MRLRKENSPPPPKPGPPRKTSRAPAGPSVVQTRSRRRRWLIVSCAVFVLISAGYVGWLALRPDPLREARAALDRRDFPAANAILEERLKSHPADQDAHLLAARIARREHSFERARAILAEYDRRNGPTGPSKLEARLLRVHSGQLNGAEQFFGEYVDRPDDPDTPWVLEAYIEGKLAVLAPRSDVQMDAKTAEAAGASNLHRATDLWLRLRRGRADQAQGLVWRGRIFLFSNDHTNGVAALHEALQVDPAHAEARFHLAMALAQESPDETVRHLELLRAAQPENYIYRFGVASTYRILGRLTEARPIFEGLLAERPDDVASLLELGHIAIDERKLIEAQDLLARALQRAPNEPQVHTALARLHQIAGRSLEAEKCRKRAEELEAERQKKRETSAKS